MSYDLGVLNATVPNPDFLAKLNSIDPCPETIFVVSHSFNLLGVMLAVGYTGPVNFADAPFVNVVFLCLFHLYIYILIYIYRYIYTVYI